MRNKKGFTLIEMLIVITLMAILMTIAIPSVLRIMESRSNDEYRYQVKLVEQAVNLYQTRYKGEFNNNSQASCFILDYQTLLDEELLEEQDISCSGKIVLTRNSKNNLNKSYYLKCVDSNNVEFSSYKQSDIPSGCIVLGTEYDDDASAITAPTIKGGNGNWVPTNIDITVEDSGISSSDVNYYEYYISSISTTPSKNVEVTGRTSNKVTISDEGTTYIWYRVIDKSGNRGTYINPKIAREWYDYDYETSKGVLKQRHVGFEHIEEFVENFERVSAEYQAYLEFFNIIRENKKITKFKKINDYENIFRRDEENDEHKRK